MSNGFGGFGSLRARRKGKRFTNLRGGGINLNLFKGKEEIKKGIGEVFDIRKEQRTQQELVPKAAGLAQEVGEEFGRPPVGTSLTVGTNVSANIPLNRKLTKEEIQTLGMSDAFEIASSQIENFMSSDPEGFREAFTLATSTFGTGGKRGNVLGFPTTVGNEDAQYLNFLLEDMADRVLRLRSGAQINEREFDRLRGLLPTFIDITSDETGDFRAVRRKIIRFRDEFARARQAILHGEKFEDVGLVTGSGDPVAPGDPLTYDSELWGDFGPPFIKGSRSFKERRAEKV